MLKKVLMIPLAVAALSMPAFAATEYFVAKNATSHKCEVTASKPDGKTWIEVGNKMYSTKESAETAMKSLTDCK